MVYGELVTARRINIFYFLDSFMRQLIVVSICSLSHLHFFSLSKLLVIRSVICAVLKFKKLNFAMTIEQSICSLTERNFFYSHWLKTVIKWRQLRKILQFDQGLYSSWLQILVILIKTVIKMTEIQLSNRKIFSNWPIWLLFSNLNDNSFLSVLQYSTTICCANEILWTSD